VENPTLVLGLRLLSRHALSLRYGCTADVGNSSTSWTLRSVGSTGNCWEETDS
jgi:hypothetical protein